MIAPSALTDVVKKTCAGCHSEQRKQGNLSLQGFDMANINGSPELAEKMIGKLRAGMMPPPGRPKPGGDTLDGLGELEIEGFGQSSAGLVERRKRVDQLHCRHLSKATKS